MVAQTQLTIATPGRGFVNITDKTTAFVRSTGIQTGLCHLFLHHTSASLSLCENADPQVQVDLEAFMSRLVPDGDPLFKHTEEGLDDMPAHIRVILTQSFLLIPITNHTLALGKWQSLYLWEHRHHPHHRTLTITIL